MEIGILLWTVRSELKKDFKGTLEALLHMGFKGAHFLGDYGGMPPEELAGFLRNIGLKACAIHASAQELSATKATPYAYALALGCKYVTMSLSQKDFPLRCAEHARLCSVVATAAAKHGLTLAYHNHSVEFRHDGGGVPFDRFCALLDKQVKLDLNVGWAKLGGSDPLLYLEKYRQRIPIMHIGDASPEGKLCDLGTGTVDVPTVVNYARDCVEWLIYDHDNVTGSELLNADTSLQYLRQQIR